MDISQVIRELNEKDGLSKTLGMEFLSTPEPDTCMARMKVNAQNRQLSGYLSGGATLALAEHLAGIGSMALCPGVACVGINVTGNHTKSVPEGETVTAHARLLHKGGTLHLWHIEIYNEAGELVSAEEVTNFMKRPRQK